MAAAIDEIESGVKAHYDAFPFPHPRHDLGGLDVSVQDLPDGSRVWIAGCGTMQAARWARAHPSCEVIGTDVSESTIEVAQELAAQHGLDNLTFEVGDLRSNDVGAAFDLVVCTGVVHHLRDPKDGLRAIAKAVRPAGEVLLMVYRRSLRAELCELQSEVRTTAGANATPDELFIAARVVVAERQDRLSTLLRRLVPATPTMVADALINPIEHHYESDEIPELLAATGLAFDRWLDTESPQLEFFARPDRSICL